ncbi:MAG TPA: GNAT family N-acetyltransferase [Gammaproteobacteria bacterium]
MVEVIRTIDLHDPRDGAALLTLLDGYARDPMGGGEPLSDEVRTSLIPQLRTCGHYLGVIAWHDEIPVGLVNCFAGFSTFAAQPLLNIHDIVVAPSARGSGLSQRLLARVEALARQRGCCKLTLEVLANNHVAMGAYRKFGFAAYQLDPQAGQALFWQKKL